MQLGPVAWRRDWVRLPMKPSDSKIKETRRHEELRGGKGRKAGEQQLYRMSSGCLWNVNVWTGMYPCWLSFTAEIQKPWQQTMHQGVQLRKKGHRQANSEGARYLKGYEHKVKNLFGVVCLNGAELYNLLGFIRLYEKCKFTITKRLNNYIKALKTLGLPPGCDTQKKKKKIYSYAYATLLT